MRVRMKTIMAGPAGTAGPGDILDLPDAVAYDLIERRFADQVEEAVTGPAETATAPAQRRGKRR